MNILTLLANDANVSLALRNVLANTPRAYTPMSDERRRELRDEGDADDVRDRIYAELHGDDA